MSVIAGLILTADRPTNALGTYVHFIAVPQPKLPFNVRYFVWNFGDGSISNVLPSLESSYHYRYKQAGKYTVNVTIANDFGPAVSATLAVATIVPISRDLLISVAGNQIMNYAIAFTASHYQGSDVTYTWTFGDNVTLTTTNPEVSHAYLRSVFNV